MPVAGWVCIGIVIALVVLVIVSKKLENKKRAYTLENGEATHGWLVQANNALFESGNMDLPALIVISPDAETNDEEFMTDLAERIMELKGESGETKDEREVARLMADEAYIAGRRDRLPEKFADGKEVYLVHIMVYRDHLPERMIEDRAIPCAIVWDEPGTVVCTRPVKRKKRRRDDEE